MKRTFLLLIAVFASRSAFAQAKPLVSRAGDIQVGAGYTYGTSDYGSDHVQGYTFYGDFDPLRHIGAEFVFHQLKDYNNPTLYERSYEVGPRYFRHYGEYSDYTPYVKALYGRGVYNFPPYPLPAPQNIAAGNLAYNMIVGGAGIDVALTTHINARADFEYQHWLGGLGLPNGLTPIIATIGVSYHVPAGKPITLTR